MQPQSQGHGEDATIHPTLISFSDGVQVAKIDRNGKYSTQLSAKPRLPLW